MSLDLSIIIINYNNAQLTVDCIQSIFEFTPKFILFEIIIVDNASKLEDFEILKTHIDNQNLSNLLLFRSKINGGFSSGNMFGVQFAKGNYLAFINNDVLLLQDCFSTLINYFVNNKNIGVIGLQPVFEDYSKQIAFGHFDTFANRILGYWLYEKLNPKKTKRHSNYEIPTVVDYVVGSFMLFKATDFYKVGGFDTNIFLYFEEMDICKRLKNNNLKSVFFPKIDYVHLNGMSTKLGYVKKIELKISHLYVVKKNYGYFSYFILKYFFVFVFLLKAIFNPKHFRMFYKLLTLGPPLSSSIKHKQTIQEK